MNDRERVVRIYNIDKDKVRKNEIDLAQKVSTGFIRLNPRSKHAAIYSDYETLDLVKQQDERTSGDLQFVEEDVYGKGFLTTTMRSIPWHPLDALNMERIETPSKIFNKNREIGHTLALS